MGGHGAEEDAAAMHGLVLGGEVKVMEGLFFSP